MTNIGFATLDVIPSLKGFQGRLERGTTPGLLAAGRTGGTKFGDAAGRSAGQRFGSVFKSVAKAGLFGGLAVAAGAIKIGADALGEAREAQKVQRQTNAVLKSTGRAAKVSSKDVGRLATNLSNMAGIDDELIQQGENVLLTFKDIRNEAGKGNKIFDKATKVALDMSTALGTDLKNANIQVGKALNDPIKGVTALTRVGVTFTDAQKEQIKTLVESGDKLGAQKLILRELNSEFQGSAKSQASSSDRLKVAFDNVKESLGKALLPVMQDFSRFLLRKGIPAAQEFVDWFTKEGIPGIKDLARKLRPLADELLPAAASGFKNIRDFAEDALPFATGIVDAFNGLPGWVKKVLIAGSAGGLAAKKLGLGKITGSLFTRGSTPANPLFVSDVSGGLGSNGKPKVPAVPIVKPGTLPKFAPLIPVGLGSAPGQNSPAFDLFGFNPFGLGEGGGNKLPLPEVEEFNRSLTATEQIWADNKAKANDYFLFVKRGFPTELHFTVLGWDVANKQARDYLATLLQIRDTHVTGGFSGDGSTTPGQPPNHSGGKGGSGSAPRTITVTNNYSVNDLKDAERRDIHKRQQVALGGFG